MTRKYIVFPHKMKAIDRHNASNLQGNSPMQEALKIELSANPNLKKTIKKIAAEYEKKWKKVLLW